jgi:hypothetical protein
MNYKTDMCKGVCGVFQHTPSHTFQSVSRKMDPQREISLNIKYEQIALHIIMSSVVSVVNMYCPTDRQGSNLYDNRYGGTRFEFPTFLITSSQVSR